MTEWSPVLYLKVIVTEKAKYDIKINFILKNSNLQQFLYEDNCLNLRELHKLKEETIPAECLFMFSLRQFDYWNVWVCSLIFGATVHHFVAHLYCTRTLNSLMQLNRFIVYFRKNWLQKLTCRYMYKAVLICFYLNYNTLQENFHNSSLFWMNYLYIYMWVGVKCSRKIIDQHRE